MKTIPMAAGVAMVIALADPALANDPLPRKHTPCPILRPMATHCALEGRPAESAGARFDAPDVG